MRQSWSSPSLRDDLPLSSLLEGLRTHITLLNSRPSTLLSFGTRAISSEDYALALQSVLASAESAPDRQLIHQILEKEFDFFIPYGSRSWGTVLLTSYYEPFLKGSPAKTPTFSEPILSTPQDLVEVGFSRTDDRFSDLGQLRGRILPERTSRNTPQLVPYFTREEISKGALKNRKLEIAWLDPVDSFFLHIQGSGIIQWEDGSQLRVGYADQNGHPYVAIGKFLKDLIPIEKMSQGTLERHLRSLEAHETQAILNRNPSYIFFQKRTGPALTSVGTPVIDGRTIATDGRFFPKGTLAYLKFEKPEFDSESSIEPSQWRKTSRLVFDQDVGGAIRGGGRVDLFWGTGDDAKRHAGIIKQEGTLYYLVPKPEFLTRLKAQAMSINRSENLEGKGQQEKTTLKQGPVRPPLERGPQQD